MESIIKQSFKDFEIIVADDGSTDHTREIASFFGAKVIVNDHIGEYPSRNAGALSAQGSILVFTGADTLMPPNILKVAAAKFARDSKLAGLYCPTFPHDGALWAKLEFTIWYALTTVLFYLTREANASTAFFAVRRTVFLRTKGFENAAHADSSFSRQISQRFKVRPSLNMVIFVSARRTHMGLRSFNKYHAAMVAEIVFRFLRKSHWLYHERMRRIRIHTRSKPEDPGSQT